MQHPPSLVGVAFSLLFLSTSVRSDAALTFEWTNRISLGFSSQGAYPLSPLPLVSGLAGQPTDKPGALFEYYYAAPLVPFIGEPGRAIMIQVMARNLNNFGVYDSDSVYFEGKIGTVQSTLRLRFFELVPSGTAPFFQVGAPKAVDGIHFEFRDPEHSEWLYNFGVYDGSENGYNSDPNVQNSPGYRPGTMLDFTDPSIFTWSGGTPVLKNGNVHYASNAEPLEPGVQDSKYLDVNLSDVDTAPGGGVYGFEVSFRRNSSEPGSMVMTFLAPEPSTALLTLVGMGMVFRRRRDA